MVRLACLGPQLVALTRVGGAAAAGGARAGAGGDASKGADLAREGDAGEGSGEHWGAGDASETLCAPKGDALLEFLAVENRADVPLQRDMLTLSVLRRRDGRLAKFGLGRDGGARGLVRGAASDAEWDVAGIVRVWGGEGPGRVRFDVMHSEDPDCDMVVPAGTLRANLRGWRLVGSFWTLQTRRLFVFQSRSSWIREVHAWPHPDLFHTHSLVDSFLALASHEAPCAKRFVVLGATDLSGRTFVAGTDLPRDGWERRFEFTAFVVPAFAGLVSRTIFRIADAADDSFRSDIRPDLPPDKHWTIQDRIFVVP
jgi:hypothetical protein